jgi:hypothetical protein
MIGGPVKGFTNIATRVLADGVREKDGKCLTRPALLITDGQSATYAVDVDLGNDQILKNVPIARANADLLYADAGNPVRLRRTDSGQWEVVGFSKEAPGEYYRFAVSLADFSFGVVEDLSTTARPLTLEELMTVGPGFGLTPFGAVGIFRAGVLQEIR